MAAESIYIHLPFCKTKCPYCDFASYANGPDAQLKQDAIDNYLAALAQEIDYRSPKDTKPLIKTIFFGGGTPSIHSSEELACILDQLKKYFVFDPAIEITLEANPGTISLEKLKAFQEIGINRISIGVQTFDENLLSKLGRGHSLADSYEMIEAIKSLDFKSWSFDLIYALPGQDLDSWRHSLEQAMSLGAPHISAYALSIEENTPFGEIYKTDNKNDIGQYYGHPDLPDSDLNNDMYKLANQIFAEHGLERYEISNWALQGHECKHNLTYWHAKEYYAFGIGAHGYLDQNRYANTRDINQYTQALKALDYAAISSFEQFVDKSEEIEEQILLGLRLREGINLSSPLSKKLNCQKLSFFIAQNLLEKVDNRLILTTEGVLLSNKVIAELIN